jgi:hypothetical protein
MGTARAVMPPLDGSSSFARASSRSATVVASVVLPLYVINMNYGQPGLFLQRHQKDENASVPEPGIPPIPIAAKTISEQIRHTFYLTASWEQ